MALTYRQKDELANALRTYALAHIGETVTIAMLKEATHTDYYPQSYIAQMDERYHRIENNRKVSYKIEKSIVISNFEKVRNTLVFKNNKDEIVLIYDFNTNTYNDDEVFVVDSFFSDSNSRRLINTLTHCNVDEWFFNYLDILNIEDLLFCPRNYYKTTCPNGYIKWCRDNGKKISFGTLKEFKENLRFQNCKDIVLVKGLMSTIKQNFGNEISEKLFPMIEKYEEKIKFAIEHEYLEAYYTDLNGRQQGWGSGSSTIEKVYSLIAKYLYICSEMEEEPIFKNTLKCYCIIKRNYDIRQNSTLSENIAKNNDKRLAFENDDIIVIVPQTYEEFKHEADYQQNCVCSYYSDRVAEGDTNVVFIRKKSEPDVPYITCEVSKRLCVNQYLTRFNRSVDDDLGTRFRRIYETYLDTLRRNG